MDKLIIRTIKFLMKFLKEKHVFVRKEFTDTIAVNVNFLPVPSHKTKIDVLRLLRLDGKSLTDALQEYNEINGIKE